MFFMLRNFFKRYFIKLYNLNYKFMEFWGMKRN